MFGVLFYSSEERTFKIFKSLIEAHETAQKFVNVLQGKAIIFDYDMDSETYTEFYEVTEG